MKKILGNKKLLIIIILVPVIALVVLKFFVMKPAPPDEKKLAKEPGPVYTLAEPFVVNLAGGGTPHFAKVGIALRVSKLSEKLIPPAEGAEAVAIEEEPEVRDIVISTISTMTPTQLLTSDGRTRVKETIVRLVNKKTELKILDVYYTEFAVQ